MIGPNGAGKSTLLRAVGGLLPAPAAVTLLRYAERPRCAAATGPGSWPRWRSPRWCRPACRCSTTCCSAGPRTSRRWAGSRPPTWPPCTTCSAGWTSTGVPPAGELATLSGGERQRVFLARALAQGAHAAAAGRADQRAGHRPPAGGAGAGRPAAPRARPDRAGHDARPLHGRRVRRPDGAARRRPGGGGRARPARCSPRSCWPATTGPGSGSSPATAAPWWSPSAPSRHGREAHRCPAASGLEHGEAGALGVAEGGAAAQEGVPGRGEDGAAEVGGAGGGRVHVGHREVHRSSTRAGRPAESPPSVGSIPATIRAPTASRCTSGPAALDCSRAASRRPARRRATAPSGSRADQLVPAHRARERRTPRPRASRMGCQTLNARAGRVGEDRHPARSQHVERGHQHLAAGRLDPGGDQIGVVGGDVRRPDRQLVRVAGGPAPGHRPAVEQEDGVAAGLGLRRDPAGPAEQFGVEAPRVLEVGGGQVGPAGRTRRRRCSRRPLSAAGGHGGRPCRHRGTGRAATGRNRRKVN